MKTKPDISVVAPFYNEEETLVDLYKGISLVMTGLGKSYELIFVDDGSTDASADKVKALAARDAAVKPLRLRGNMGKSAALAAGFDGSRGQVIITMDADLQDDPADIPKFLTKLDEGYDLVSGYKKQRHDPWHKVYPSRGFNVLVRWMTGITLHDVNCGFKCFRREVMESIVLYGELHRFLPVLVHWRKFRLAEVVVTHHARTHGHSKYGVRRLYRGLIDLFTVAFLTHYDQRPSHLFGTLGVGLGGVGTLVCLYISTLWLSGERPANRPLLFLGILLIIVGVQLVATGLIAELITHAMQGRQRPYILLPEELSEDPCEAAGGGNAPRGDHCPQ